MKILNWYKLANEAALKAALVKSNRARQQPRYNPAAESVKERTRWLQRVIAEEQSKPLEVTESTFKHLLESEHKETTRLEEQLWRRKERLQSMQEFAEHREGRRRRYQGFLKRSEQQRQQALLKARSLGLGKVENYEEPPDFGELKDKKDPRLDEEEAEQKFAYTMNHLMDLESTVSDLVRSRTSHGNRSINVTVSTPDWQAADGREVERSAQVTFVKRRSEAKLASPSKVSYSVRLLPVSGAGDAVSLPSDPLRGKTAELPPTHSRLSQRPPRAATAPGIPSGRRSRQKSSSGSRPVSVLQLEREVMRANDRATRSSNQVLRRQRQEEQKVIEYQKQDRVNAIIKEWLHGRLQRKIQREQRISDKIKADRHFVRELNVSKQADKLGATDKDREGGAEVDSPKETEEQQDPQNQGRASPSGKGAKTEWLEDEEALERRLDLLRQQQTRMEHWKPRVGTAPG